MVVRAPTAASNGNGEESWLAKWCTRKYAPSAPTSSAATARSMDCSRTSEADRASECGEDVQWPNDKKPMRFMTRPTYPRSLLFLFKACNAKLVQPPMAWLSRDSSTNALIRC